MSFVGAGMPSTTFFSQPFGSLPSSLSARRSTSDCFIALTRFQSVLPSPRAMRRAISSAEARTIRVREVLRFMRGIVPFPPVPAKAGTHGGAARWIPAFAGKGQDFIGRNLCYYCLPNLGCVNMSKKTSVSKVSVALTSEMTELVDEAVASGDYASGSEVIREALREWKLRRTLRFQERDELRRLWDEGLASGPGRRARIAAIKREARRRLKKAG